MLVRNVISGVLAQIAQFGFYGEFVISVWSYSSGSNSSPNWQSKLWTIGEATLSFVLFCFFFIFYFYF